MVYQIKTLKLMVNLAIIHTTHSPCHCKTTIKTALIHWTPRQNIIGQNVVGQNVVGQNVVGENVVGQNVVGQVVIGQNVIGQVVNAQSLISP